MNFDLLFPTQETEVAHEILEFADRMMEGGFAIARKVAKQIIDAKYWEAYDCEKGERCEYWRVVANSLDIITDFRVRIKTT